MKQNFLGILTRLDNSVDRSLEDVDFVRIQVTQRIDVTKSIVRIGMVVEP